MHDSKDYDYACVSYTRSVEYAKDMESNAPKNEMPPDTSKIPDLDDVTGLSRSERVLVTALGEIEHKCEQVGHSIESIKTVVNNLSAKLQDIHHKNNLLEKEIIQFRKKNRLVLVSLCVFVLIVTIIRVKTVLQH